MEQSVDRTKIHFNPDFISRSGALPKQKVHINPAFLHKSQSLQQDQQQAAAGVSYGSTTGYKMPQPSLNSWSNTSAKQGSTSLDYTHDRNTTTNIYSHSSKSKDNRVPSSHPKSNSLYKKSNVYNPYDQSFSNAASKTKTTEASAVNYPPSYSAYSWKATNTNSWTQGNSFRAANPNSIVSARKDCSFITQRYLYPDPKTKYSPGHRSYIRTRNQSPQAVPVKSEENMTCSRVVPMKSEANTNTKVVQLKNISNLNPTTQAASEKIKPSHATQSVTARGVPNPSVQVVKVKSDPSPVTTSTQDTGGRLKEIESEVISPVNVTGLSPSKPVQQTPKQKWVSKNKLVNSSPKKPVQGKVDIKTTNSKLMSKFPKHKGNYKVMTKTKLVRTPTSVTRSKVQQQGAAGNYSKITSASPKIYKLSPAFFNRKKYCVLSRTKLVRRESLSGKGGTPGKPKYSVNTKNKLVRRRSNSGSASSKSLSKASESKPTTIKIETEKQKKFHVLSKTKIIRRRSGSVNKGVTGQSLTAAASSGTRKRSIVKRHKLVRNVPTSSVKHGLMKLNRSLPKKVNTAFKVINVTPKLSTKQRIAKGIVSKYKINRVKLESHDGYKKSPKSLTSRYKVNRLKTGSTGGLIRYKKFIHYPTGAKQKTKFNFHNKKVCPSKRSDRFININGILYKSTKTSLIKRQLPKENKTSMRKRNSTCIVLLRGEKFHLTAGGKTLQRIKTSRPAKTSLPRVHLGGLTYSRTRTGLYELTKTHHTRAVLSSARQRSMVTLIHKGKKASFQKRNEYCIFFNRFGRCSRKNRGECAYIHDQSRVAVCTRFLRGRCPVNKCPFSHTVDPDKMPVCSHFLQAACTREDCPYRHVKVNPSAPICLNFVRGHCKDGQECDKQHILICEEFKTGKCPRGSSCPLSHHKGRVRPRRVSFSRETIRRHSSRKRKSSENQEVLGGLVKKRPERRKQQVKPAASSKRYFHVLEDKEEEEEDSRNNSEHSNDLKEESAHPKEQNTMKGQTREDESPKTEKSEFEETRSRLMRKVHKMKQSYASFSSGNGSKEEADIEVDCEGEQEQIKNTEVENDNANVPRKEENCKADDVQRKTESKADNLPSELENDKNIAPQNITDAEKTGIDDQRVQRPKLPKRLPSYIPLDSDSL